MSEEHWKLEKDLCRCCLSEGSFKNLAEPCAVPGVGNIEYSEMLLESLDVNITPVAGSLCASTFTICDECILRLQDACIFKRQVLTSEKRFRDLYSRNVFESHSKELAVKKEALDSDNEDAVKMELEPDDDDFRLEYDDHDDNKSDIELDLQAVKKAKTKKPKGKEKPKPKKRAVRPRKPAEAEPGTEAEGEAEPKAKKDASEIPDDADYTTVEEEGEKQYACKICGLVYKSLSWIKRHVSDHAAVEEEKTMTCEQKEKERNSILQDMYTIPARGRGRFAHNVCKVCKQLVTTDLVEHLKTHGIFKWRMCPTEFATKDELVSHTLDNPKKTFLCEECGAEVRGSESDMMKHLRKHGFFKCASCPKVYANRRSWCSHRSAKHAELKHACGACDYKGVTARELVSHQRRVHLKEKNVTCRLCDAKFFSNSSLKDHMVRHNPVKKFECRFCQKIFPRAETRKRHEMIHTGEKKKVCQVCGERFVQKASLSYHMKKHHPDAV